MEDLSHLYEVSSWDVAAQSFVLMQGNGCSLKVISDADGDSQYTEEQLYQLAKNMAGWLNDNG